MESMAALWTEHTENDENWHTCRDFHEYRSDQLGGSRNQLYSATTSSKLNIELVIAPEPLIVEEWNLVHPIALLMLITFNSLH